MSSLRNAVKRIAHKERSQPVDRQHLGILEKKKDYKQRAVDYHRKQDRIKAMKQKVSMRNPDEFYFGMHNSSVEGGKHQSNEDYRMLSPELLKVMKDQDLSYFRMQKQKDTKKAEKLQASLHLLDSDASETIGSKRKHTIFVQDKTKARDFDIAEHFETVPEFEGRAFNRLRKREIERLSRKRIDGGEETPEAEQQQKQLTADQLHKLKKTEQKLAKKLARARSSAYREMESRRERAEKMKEAEDHLITEKLVAGNGRKRKISAGENGKPAQYKWRRKRLR
jgi:U3 small nucleolar RNA-associated protein 11